MYICELCGAHLDPGEKCNCKKIDIEFCRTSYRQAKDPEKQVSTLSQRYSVTKTDIIRVLGDLYGARKSSAQKRENKGKSKQVARLKALLEIDILTGMTVREAAQHRGVSYQTAADYTRELRKRLKDEKTVAEQKKTAFAELMEGASQRKQGQTKSLANSTTSLRTKCEGR